MSAEDCVCSHACAPARAFAARPSPSAAASEFQLRADGSGAKVGVRATAATTSSPAVTRPTTTLAPSSDGTGPGPVVMRNPAVVIGTVISLRDALLR